MTELVFLAGILVAFIFIVFVTAIIASMTKRKHVYTSAVKQQTEKPKRKGKPDVDDLMNVLDHMLAMNVIDTKEYNQLIVKSAPHFK